MKQAIILLSMILLSLISRGQTPFDFKGNEKKDSIYKKELYFNDPKNLVEDTLRFNRKYKYVLKNINRFVYKEATAEQKGENLNIEKPEIFKGIKFPGFTTNSGQVAMGIMSENGDTINLVLHVVCDTPCITKDKLINSSAILQAQALMYQSGANMFEKKVDTFSTFSGVSRKLEKLKTNLILTWPQIYNAKRRVMQDSVGLVLQEKDTNKISQKYDTIMKAAILIYDSTLVPASEVITGAADSIVNIYKLCLYNLMREMRCMDSCYRKTEKNKICKQDSIFKNKEDKYRRLENCLTKLRSFSDGIKEDMKEAGIAISEMKKAFDEGKVDIVQDNYNMLVSENFELELEPFKADKDTHEIIFTATAEGPLVYGKPAKRTIKIKAITTGGWKIDYSTGAFYNMGSNNFLGPQYYFENRAIDSTKAVIEAKRTKKAMLSVGALMHIYPRINFWLRPGFALGVSTTLGFDVLNFHGGVSLLIGKPGKANRVIISGGLTLREVSLLDSRYKLNEFRKDYGDDVPTSKNFPVSGGFLSFTYNLTGINK